MRQQVLATRLHPIETFFGLGSEPINLEIQSSYLPLLHRSVSALGNQQLYLASVETRHIVFDQ
jgi:hypothetical protein